MGLKQPDSGLLAPGSNGLVAPTRVRYLVLLAACVLAVITYAQRVGFAVAGPYLKDSLCLTDQDIGYLMTAFLVAYGAFEVPCGLLGDKLGVRHLLTILVLGWSLFTGLLTLVDWLPATVAVQLSFLLLLRFLFGMFQAGGFPSLARMMGDWMPAQERASAQGLIWMASRAGGALSPLLLVPLFDLYGEWQTPFWLLAGLGLAWCAAFWPWFRNYPEEMPRVNRAESELIRAGGTKRTAGHGHAPWSRMLRSLSVWSLCLAYGFGGFAGNFFVTLLPTYLRDHRKLTEAQTGWLTALPLAFGMISCLAGGLLSDWIIRRWGNRKWGRRLNGSVGLIVAGLAYLSTIWVQEVWLLALLLSATFFCNDLAMGPAWAACADIGGRYAGTLGGAMNMMANLFGAVAALITGYLLGSANPSLVFVVLASSYGVAAVCWWGVDVTKTVEEP